MVASNFFLAAYALMNLSCFHSSITKVRKKRRKGPYPLGPRPPPKMMTYGITFSLSPLFPRELA